MRSAAQKAAQRKAALASARARKRKYMDKNRKKITSGRNKRRFKEYKKTGLVTPTASRTWGQTTRKLRKGSKLNRKHGKRLAKHDKRIAKYKARAR